MRERPLSILSVVGFLAACAWPFANFASANLSQLSLGAYGRPDEIAFFTMGMALLGVLVSTAAGFIRTQYSGRVYTVLSAGVFLLFLSGFIHASIRTTGVSSGGTLWTILVLLALSGGVWFLSRFEPVRLSVAVASLTALALPLSDVALSAPSFFRQIEAKSPAIVDTKAASLSGENVYYIIVDGYASSETLREFGFDNLSFVRDMQEVGFHYDKKARSNYVMTYLSLMAILEGDYPVSETGTPYTDRAHFFPVALNNGYRPQALGRLMDGGYTAMRVSNWWAGCGDEVFDECFENPTSSRSYALDTFLEPTILRQFSNWANFFRTNDTPVPDSGLALLGHYLPEIWSRQPFFVLVHHLAPHAPFDRNADCSTRSTEGDTELARDRKISLYLSAVVCVQSQILEQVADIIDRDPSAIIVVQSDHGSDFKVDWEAALTDWSDEAIRERTGIISLVRMPPSCDPWVTDGLGQINTMRLVIACLERSPPIFLDENTFISAYEGNSEFGNVLKMH